MIKDFPSIDIPIILKLYELYNIIHKTIMDFPKTEKYSLGEKIEKTILDSIHLSISANNETKYNKEDHLINLQSNIELLKIIIRLAHQIECIKKIEKYIEIQNILQETSKMTAGWIKYVRSN